MKIDEYPKIESLEPTDSFIVETDEGTKHIQTTNMTFPQSLSSDHAIAHKTVIRGKNLGDTYTPEQKEAIQSGTFDDLYLGDYWEKDDIQWQIVDINYYDNGINHLVIMPTKPVSNTFFDDRTSTVPQYSGYGTSQIRVYPENHGNGIYSLTKVIYENILPIFNNHDNIMGQNLYLSRYVESTQSNNIAFEYYENDLVVLPSATQILGISANPDLYPSALQNKPQFAYFKLNNNWRFMNNNESFWLQDVYNAHNICICSGYGITYDGPGSIHGVRPYFCLK